MVEVTNLLVLEWRIQLAIAEAGIGTGVDDTQRRDAGIVGAGIGHIKVVDRAFQAVIRHQAAGVAQVRRAEQRQHQVRAGRYAVVPQGLAEVLAQAWQAHLGGRVPQATDSDDGIEEQPCSAVHRPLALELQQAVGQRGNFPQIVEEVVHAGLHQIGCDVAVAVDHGQEDPLIETVVEVVDAAVP